MFADLRGCRNARIAQAAFVSLSANWIQFVEGRGPLDGSWPSSPTLMTPVRMGRAHVPIEPQFA